MLRRTLLLSAAASALNGCANTPEPTTAAATADEVFDVALYKRLATSGGNQFISPYSVSAAFALLYPGARGETARQIAETLGFDTSQTEAIRKARATADALWAQTGGSEFQLANAAWVERTMPLEADYARAVAEGLKGEVRPIGFIADPPGAVREINAWASDNTRGRIPSILGAANPSRRLVLTNAVYFKGKWQDPFSAAATTDGVFHAEGGDIPARLMRQQTHARYFETRSFRAAELIYDRGAFALAIFLPRERSSLVRFEAELNSARLDEWLERLGRAEPVELDITLPKVKLESHYPLGETLRTMGMRAPFEAADFSGVTRAAPLAISEVVHKTFLAIDEEGTEAAAVTAVEVVITAARVPQPPPIPFKADRPHFIVLHHRASGVRLFLGRIARPTGT